MKKIRILLFILICLFISNINVKADTYNGYISCNLAPDGLNLRTSIDGAIGSYSTCGNELVILEKDVASSAICANWYKVKYNNNVYYACGDYITINSEITKEETSDYTEYLKKAGFPDSYIPMLLELHIKHPSWEFKVFNADISFNDMVKYEYDGHSQGWSLIWDSNSSKDGYKSTDSWAYNYLTDVFRNNYEGGGSVWYAASKNTIAYYLDPRNFLNDSQIFMFETLSYNSDYHTSAGVEAMLKGTFMEEQYADSENTKTYVDAFIDAAITNNVSPYVLVSRVIQEVGSQGSTIVSGTYSPYEGYYNFYNIKAYGNTKEETISAGLAYAVSQGWDSPYKAIVGGANFLNKDYISQGQDTLYLQKWDLYGPKYANHQYMQNIQAPATESVKTYNGYKNISLLDSSFVFRIPVFSNMPSETKLDNSGNPNNFLSSLKVNDIYLFESATYETTFSLELDESVTSILIDATKVNNKATIDGLGTIALSGAKQTVTISVIAANGDVRTYTINITRNISDKVIDDNTDNNSDSNTDNNVDNTDNNVDNSQENNTSNNDITDKDNTLIEPVSNIITNLNIKTKDNYIYGYEVGTDISSIISNIKNNYDYVNINTNGKTSGIIATGDTLTIKTDNEEKEYTIVIYGDVNGDGKINYLDYVSVYNHIQKVKHTELNKELLVNEYVEAADISNDNEITYLDYVKIYNKIKELKGGTN